MNLRFLRYFGLCAPLLMLGGCSTDVFRLFHPTGPVADAEYRYTLILVGVMMLIILPTLALTIIFPLRYRKARKAAYAPDWSHSLGIEIAAWGVPFLITAVLIYYSFNGIYAVNPYNPKILDSAASTATAPLKVDVISTDWQWLFIYPDQHIATIDDLVVPAGRRVDLRLTSTSVMNAFYIPQVAAMMDAMPAMYTKDAFLVNKPGTFTGFSGEFSGAGFSWMHFATRVVPTADFENWVNQVQASPKQLDYTAFQKLAQPTVNIGAKPSYFSHVAPGLFDKVVQAAMHGVVYNVPDSLTKGVADDEGKAGAKAPAHS